MADLGDTRSKTPEKVADKLGTVFTSAVATIQQWLGLVRFKEFDTSTPEGRSQERYRRLALTAVSSTGAKLVTVATMLISIPLTLNYLGSERYGLWMTISSIIAMMGFADLGMGLGLMNAVSEAHGQEDPLAAERYVSSGFFMLAAVALVLLAGFALAYPAISWPRVFNVHSQQAIREAGPAIAVFIGCFAANLPLGVVRNVQHGYQEGFINNLWESAGKLLGLLGLLLVIYLQAGLVWLVLALTGAPAVALLLNNLELFGYRRPWLRPRLGRSMAPAPENFFTPVFFFP